MSEINGDKIDGRMLGVDMKRRDTLNKLLKEAGAASLNEATMEQLVWLEDRIQKCFSIVLCLPSSDFKIDRVARMCLLYTAVAVAQCHRRTGDSGPITAEEFSTALNYVGMEVDRATGIARLTMLSTPASRDEDE